MFLKLKSDEVTIKGRGCADGRKQRDWLYKEYMLLLTVSTEDLMLSCIIDAMEGREVATADIPGAYYRPTMTREIYTSNWKGIWSPYLKRLTRNIIKISFSQINA